MLTILYYRSILGDPSNAVFHSITGIYAHYSLVKCSSLDHSHIVKRDINMLHAKNTC